VSKTITPEQRLKNTLRKAEWRARNRDKDAAAAARYRAKHPERVKAADRARYAKDPSRKGYVYKWREADPERAKECHRKHYRSNKDRYIANAAKRRTQLKTNIKLTKTQKQELIEIYKNRPEGYHVDHIIPLNGAGVCGLHAPWNLQYLPAAENLKKSNKCPKL
jgi:hypothetical protein